jgi:hypothetical protein
MSKIMSDIQKTKLLNEVLSRSVRVTRFNSGDFVEADAIANAIVDMEKTFKVLTENLFPKLLETQRESADTDEILWEIRDNLRHIVYHIKDCRTFDGVC